MSLQMLKCWDEWSQSSPAARVGMEGQEAGKFSHEGWGTAGYSGPGWLICDLLGLYVHGRQ